MTLKLTVRPKTSLPHTDLGWVRMHDHFLATVGPSAGQGSAFGELLVMADATFAPKSKFPLHSHQEIEVVSLVLQGTLTHHEPNVALPLPEGATQLMSARDGVTHAEGNLTDQPVRMLQIWIQPNQFGGPPEYSLLGPFELGAKWTQVTPKTLRQDATVSMAKLKPFEQLELEVKPGRALYLTCTLGEGELGGQKCGDGDGVRIDSGKGALTTKSGGTFVLIDLVAPKVR